MKTIISVMLLAMTFGFSALYYFTEHHNLPSYRLQDGMLCEKGL